MKRPSAHQEAHEVLSQKDSPVPSQDAPEVLSQTDSLVLSQKDRSDPSSTDKTNRGGQLVAARALLLGGGTILMATYPGCPHVHLECTQGAQCQLPRGGPQIAHQHLN